MDANHEGVASDEASTHRVNLFGETAPAKPGAFLLES
jgi:hypothetical protein